MNNGFSKVLPVIEIEKMLGFFLRISKRKNPTFFKRLERGWYVGCLPY
jgi:hypothetical protein